MMIKASTIGGLAVVVATAGEVRAQSQKVAHWNFNEGSGLTVTDSTGNGNTGTLQEDVAWTTNGFFGNALYFNGTNSAVRIPYSTSIGVLPEVRQEARIKRDSISDGMILSKNGPYYLCVRDNKVEGGVYAGNGWEQIRGVTSLETNKWYKLAVSYDGSFIRVFVNEREDASIARTGSILNTSQSAHIGWGEPGHNQYFQGIIDEVSIYATAQGEGPKINAASKNENTFSLSFESFPDRTYDIETSPNALDWKAFISKRGATNASTTSVTLTNQTEAIQFYRVKQY